MKKRQTSLDRSIKSLWAQIEDWLTHNWKGELKLPPPATETEVRDVEASLGVRFPKVVTDSYRIHNGSGKITLVPFEPWGMTYPLLALPKILRNWEMIQDGVRRGYYSGSDFVGNPKGPIKKEVWFHKAWIPIVDDQSGDYVFVDMAPAKGGNRGQVIEFTRHAGPTKVLAPSFTELLSHVATRLAAGDFKFDRKSQSLVRNGK